MPEIDFISIIERLGSFGLLGYLAVYGIPSAIRYVTAASKELSVDNRAVMKEISDKNSEALGRIAEEYKTVSRIYCEFFSERHVTMMAAINKQSQILETALKRLEEVVHLCQEGSTKCPIRSGEVRDHQINIKTQSEKS